jgi:hypothetical protein
MAGTPVVPPLIGWKHGNKVDGSDDAVCMTAGALEERGLQAPMKRAGAGFLCESTARFVQCMYPDSPSGLVPRSARAAARGGGVHKTQQRFAAGASAAGASAAGASAAAGRCGGGRATCQRVSLTLARGRG